MAPLRALNGTLSDDQVVALFLRVHDEHVLEEREEHVVKDTVSTSAAAPVAPTTRGKAQAASSCSTRKVEEEREAVEERKRKAERKRKVEEEREAVEERKAKEERKTEGEERARKEQEQEEKRKKKHSKARHQAGYVRLLCIC